MSNVVEEPEGIEESSPQGWEDSYTRSSSTNGGADWRGKPYHVPPGRPAENFRGAKRYEINGGNFGAVNGTSMFENTEDFSIKNGEFTATGHRRVENHPGLPRAEMFKGASGHTINRGTFTTAGNASGFENTENIVINDGTFWAVPNPSQLPPNVQQKNYWPTQGNPCPWPQGQQGKSYDPRAYSLGYPPNHYASSNNMQHFPPPPVRGTTFNGPYPNHTGLNPIHTAPIPPSHSEGQGYFNNTGSGRGAPNFSDAMHNNNGPSPVDPPSPGMITHRPHFFRGLTNSTITGGNFIASGETTMFQGSNGVSVSGGRFTSCDGQVYTTTSGGDGEARSDKKYDQQVPSSSDEVLEDSGSNREVPVQLSANTPGADSSSGESASNSSR
ncbi:hypothetical protein M413DRAFT_31648 [Hebeloma cylindrosporum]|uniref:Uncharacterized protein n=1 Tax=Hebeloma cylindrosporum TaxID=76867 RepID=A0A0C2XEP5_HEBCY|nr:hypothetical protein M413DRAFT_31648 [Hebeloma cylindrosporum h7]